MICSASLPLHVHCAEKQDISCRTEMDSLPSFFFFFLCVFVCTCCHCHQLSPSPFFFLFSVSSFFFFFEGYPTQL